MNEAHELFLQINPLSANPTKWPNTLKQFVGKLPTNCLSVFGHFVKLALKGLSTTESRMYILNALSVKLNSLRHPNITLPYLISNVFRALLELLYRFGLPKVNPKLLQKFLFYHTVNKMISFLWNVSETEHVRRLPLNQV